MKDIAFLAKTFGGLAVIAFVLWLFLHEREPRYQQNRTPDPEMPKLLEPAQ